MSTVRGSAVGTVVRIFGRGAGLLLLGYIACGLSLAAPIPSEPGWYELPSTKLRSVCPNEPSIQGMEGCAGVVDDWSGGAVDTKRSRLLIWGGGHMGYLGNEVYAVNLETSTVSRLNEPSLGPPKDCGNNGMMPDGTPVSRHTLNHLAYMEHVDRMYAFGGMGVPCGWMLTDTWTLDLNTMKWQRMNPSGPIPDGTDSRLAAYDPNTKKIYIHDWFSLFSYSFESDSYTRLSSTQTLPQDMIAVIDTKRRLFVMVGGGNVFAYDISPGSSYVRQKWNTTGATEIVNGRNIGLAYDSANGRIVAWNGGNAVYSLDPDTKEWTKYTYPNGPGAPAATGTYGRFGYVPGVDAFVVVNSVDRNAYALRLPSSLVRPKPPTDVRARAQ